MKQQNIPWTTSHSFYLIMGGFTFDFGDTPTDLDDRSKVRTLEIKDLPGLIRHQQVDFGAFTKEYIDDRSKTDTLTRIIWCLTSTRLVIQVLARLGQHLPVTPLEAATTGYVPWTLLSFYLWWNKVHPYPFSFAATLSDCYNDLPRPLG